MQRGPSLDVCLGHFPRSGLVTVGKGLRATAALVSLTLALQDVSNRPRWFHMLQMRVLGVRAAEYFCP